MNCSINTLDLFEKNNNKHVNKYKFCFLLNI